MKSNFMLALLKRLEPILKKYFGEILYRFHAEISPFFKPVVKYGAYIAALSIFLYEVKDELIKGGVPLPDWFSLVVAMVGSASGAVAFICSFTLSNEAAQKLAENAGSV